MDAPTLLRDDHDKVDESTSITESQEDGPKTEEISKDGAKQEIVEREKITQTTQGIEVTTSCEATISKSAEDKAKDYSSFTTWEKRFIVFTATIAALFSPFTAQIYFPALNTIAKDLHVTNSKVNLTVTTYMVCFLSLSDSLSQRKRSPSGVGVNRSIDSSSNCPSFHRRLFRQRWKTAGIHHLLRSLHNSRHSSRHPE